MTIDRPSAAPIHGLARAISASAAIECALATGVLDAIEEGTATPADLAARLGTDERATALLLEALVDAGAARIGPDGRARNAIDPDALRLLLRPWTGLDEFVRTGRRDRRLSTPSYRPLTPALGAVDPSTVEAVCRQIGDPGRLLDVGAGAAQWTTHLLRAHRMATATLVDLPDVAPITADAVDAAGVADRCEVLAGDIFDLRVDGTFDTVLVANVCRLFAEDEVRRLLRDLAARTAPGGRILLLEALPDADRSDEASVGLYALGLALRTASGGVHPFSAYAAWLFDAGFVHIETEPLGFPELSLVRATRPT